MAEKRMFSNQVIFRDSFLEMPDSTQNLYFHLSMNADDDGFVDKPKSIMRMTGKKEDDLRILIAKSFIIPFDTGVVVIKHWRINNYLRSDRYKETQYTQEKSTLTLLENGEYELGTPNGIPMVTIDKIRLEENSKERNIKERKVTTFQKPTLEEIVSYCKERDNSVNPNKFYDFYEAKGWMVGKNKMKDWKAAVRTWESDLKVKKQEEAIPYAN